MTSTNTRISSTDKLAEDAIDILNEIIIQVTEAKTRVSTLASRARHDSAVSRRMAAAIDLKNLSINIQGTYYTLYNANNPPSIQ